MLSATSRGGAPRGVSARLVFKGMTRGQERAYDDLSLVYGFVLRFISIWLTVG